MSHIYDFFDDRMEICGAVIFGVVTVVVCVAMGAALCGAM